MKKYVLADGTKDKRRLGFGDYLIYELAGTVPPLSAAQKKQ